MTASDKYMATKTIKLDLELNKIDSNKMVKLSDLHSGTQGGLARSASGLS